LTESFVVRTFTYSAWQRLAYLYNITQKLAKQFYQERCKFNMYLCFNPWRKITEIATLFSC